MCPTLERRENTAEAGRICANGVRQKVRVLSARRTFGESAFGEFAFRAQLQTKASHFLSNRKNFFLFSKLLPKASQALPACTRVNARDKTGENTREKTVHIGAHPGPLDVLKPFLVSYWCKSFECVTFCNPGTV